ncbi:hypothetical protein FA15DRAFT_299155 [Coprinopsis marcescibilis]|uniref:Uncharacterized protein n=1 Tax=Coprinopsis marcescibilis TaxID=230819 RepID=A0A5C3L006_COPMA|nr:hypothetical protein FA15DRAFT_299155 [Coprinopsis marcescibilis]
MSSNSPFQYGGDASGSNSYSAYSPPGTSGGYLGGGGYEEDSGRPMTSAGRKGGDGNPFRQLTEQQKQQQQAGPPPTYDPNSSTSRNPYASPPPQSSYGYDSYGGKPPQSSYGYGAGASYGGPPPQSSYGYGYDDSSRGHGLEEEEEEDESDAEDVFAFLPPTTAEVEEERKQKERQEREREEYERRRREQEQAQVMQHAHLLGAAGLRHSMSQSQSQARSQQPFASSSTQGQLKEEESRRVREEPATFAFTVDSADSAGYSGSTAKRPPPTGTTDGDYGVYQAREHERHMQTQYPRYGVETPYQGVYRYDPPVSPPSTESTNSFDVIASRHPSRAGAGEKADKGDEGGGGYRMTRLDPRKSLEREEREKKEREEKGEDESVTVTASFDANKDSPVLKEGDITDVTLDPDTLVVRQNADGTPTLNKEKGRQVDEEKQDEDLDELQAKKKEKAPLGSGGGSFGKHWEHFQPNPSRFNSNSGPYKRHREYHYNQAYPQYANTGRTTARSDTEGDNSSTPLGGMTAVGVPEGRSRRRRKRGKSSQGPGSRQGTAMADERLGTAVTEGTNYLAGSEYTGDRPVSSGRLGTGHASLGYLEKASRSELEEYQEQRDDHPDDPDEYDDYEDDYDAESREGSIK